MLSNQLCAHTGYKKNEINEYICIVKYIHGGHRTYACSYCTCEPFLHA